MPSLDLSKLLPAGLEDELNSCTNLPSLPAVVLQIIEASKDPDISLLKVSEIILSDPAIAIKILKIANSALYSPQRPISNIRDALSLLGFNASLTIGLSFSLLQVLGGNDENNKNFWKRSILSATVARIFGSRLKVIRLEELFLASLLQDIGILVIQCLNSSPYPKDEMGNLNHQDRCFLEQKKLGVQHPVIGAWLLDKWDLPDYLIKSILFSHSLNLDENSLRKDEVYFHYLLHLSGSVADIWLEENPGEVLVSVLGVVKEFMNLDNIAFNELIVEIDAALPEVSSMFEMSIVKDDEREKVINEAREILLEQNIDIIKHYEDDRRHIEDITKRIEEIEKTSRIDHLTKAYNRSHIDNVLKAEYEEANINKWPLSLAFIDVDDFKLINDTYGHLVGDETLKLISEFFKDHIRDTDILARYGGDEFLLLFPRQSALVAASAIERLLELYKKQEGLKVKNFEVFTTVSVGLATHMDQIKFDDLNEFISAADEALYKAKAAGKNCFTVYELTTP